MQKTWNTRNRNIKNIIYIQNIVSLAHPEIITTYIDESMFTKK